MSSKRSKRRRALILLLLLAGAASAVPMEIPPTEWPLERITTNLEQSLRESPENAQVHYNLGRAYGFAFALERSTLWGGSWLVVELDEQKKHASAGEPPTSSQTLERLANGVFHLRKACELDGDPTSSLYYWWNPRKHLTFAWLLETGAHLADRVATMEVLGVSTPVLPSEERAAFERWIDELGSDDAAVAQGARESLASPAHLERALPLLVAQSESPNARRQKAVAALLERYWIERAIAEYWQAYEQRSDLPVPDRDYERVISHLVCYEALLGYARLVRGRGVQGPEEERRLVELAERQKELESHEKGTFITPLLLSPKGCPRLDELVTPDLAVPFDLDGDGLDELWPWITADAGWLVWDPDERGEITSGRQLFGSASAWLFFEDGYRVLDALDDDRDGELRGRELAGIRVWFDRDTDGVSDRGEVVSIEDLGIVALSTQSTLSLGPSPANLCGAELADGRVLPTYDWVLESIRE